MPRMRISPCEYCCKDFAYKRSRPQRFCSKSCAASGKKSRHWKHGVCPVCSTPWFSWRKGRVYCSIKCRVVGVKPKQQANWRNQTSGAVFSSAWITDAEGNLSRRSLG